jgi:hypothetical protein
MNHFPEFVLILFLVISLVTLLWSLNLRYRRRVLQHRERMAAIEKGVDLPGLKEMPDQPWSPRLYLLRGMIWLFAGIGLAIFLLGLSYTTRETIGPEHKFIQAQRYRMFGIPEDQIKHLMAQHNGPTENKPVAEGWALLALIPIGVGMAYIIFYRSEMSRTQQLTSTE